MVGEKLVEILTRKAKEGVEVWVMCDFIANLSTPKKMFHSLVNAGGKVVRVKPYFTHYRSHRKIVSIDQKIAYIGGMNIGKQYANLDKVKTPWRDTQIRLEGACASVLNTYFLKDWLCSIKRCDWDHTIAYIKQMETKQYEITPSLCQFIAGGVDVLFKHDSKCKKTDSDSVSIFYTGCFCFGCIKNSSSFGSRNRAYDSRNKGKLLFRSGYKLLQWTIVGIWNKSLQI